MGTRTALPVLQGLLCEVTGSTLRVTGTDLDMTVRTQAEVEVMEEGRSVIPGRLLSEAVRKMPAGQVTIGVSETDIEIQGNGPRFTLRPLTVDDFPTQDEVVADGVEVDGERLDSGHWADVLFDRAPAVVAADVRNGVATSVGGHGFASVRVVRTGGGRPR